LKITKTRRGKEKGIKIAHCTQTNGCENEGGEGLTESYKTSDSNNKKVNK